MPFFAIILTGTGFKTKIHTLLLVSDTFLEGGVFSFLTLEPKNRPTGYSWRGGYLPQQAGARTFPLEAKD